MMFRRSFLRVLRSVDLSHGMIGSVRFNPECFKMPERITRSFCERFYSNRFSKCYNDITPPNTIPFFQIGGKRHYAQNCEFGCQNRKFNFMFYLVSGVLFTLIAAIMKKKRSERNEKSKMSEEEVEVFILKYKKELKSKKERRENYYCGKNYIPLQKVQTWKDYATKRNIRSDKSKNVFERNDELNKKITLYKGNICPLEVDAVQNAARPSMKGGGGIDGAIHYSAGWKELVTLSKSLYVNGCPTGAAKITPGLKLPAPFIIHTVGPVYFSPSDNESLESCYRNTFALVKKYDLKSVALCSVSTGAYGFPHYEAALIAVGETRKWLEENKDKVNSVIFCVYDDRQKEIYEEVLSRCFPV